MLTAALSVAGAEFTYAKDTLGLATTALQQAYALDQVMARRQFRHFGTQVTAYVATLS